MRVAWALPCCHVQKAGAESEHLDGVSSSLASGLGDNRVQALASNFGVLLMGALIGLP